MYEPDRPGSNIPLIPTIPHKKIKSRFEFSLPGAIKFNEIAILVPIINATIEYLFHFFTLLPTKTIEAKISPKKNAQINIG